MIDFIVETGVGLTNSTSYVDIDYFRDYWETLGITFSESDDTLSAWLNEATRYVDLNYRFYSVPTTQNLTLYPGLVTKTQALEFPRLLWGTEIPIELKKGVCELAYARQGIDSDNKISTGISSESYGPVSVSYSSSSSNSKIVYKTANLWLYKICYTKVRRILPT